MRPCRLLVATSIVLLLAGRGASAITVTVNGRSVSLHPPAVMAQGQVLAPVRAVFEALGGKVAWAAASQSATGTLGDQTVRVRVNSRTAYINDRAVVLDVPVRWVNGSAYVPLALLAEVRGVAVSWQPEADAVTIALASPAPRVQQGTVSGTVAGIFPDRIALAVGPELRLIDATRSTTVLREGQPATLDRLAIGDPVAVTYDVSGRATRIQTTYASVTGTVEVKTSRDVLLSGQVRPVRVCPQVVVTTATGAAGTYGEVKVGDQVEVRLDPVTDNAYAIVLLGPGACPQVSISENLPQPLVPGDSFLVTVQAEPGSEVEVDLGDVLTGIRLTEVKRGVYIGQVVVPCVAGEQCVQVTARVRTPEGQQMVACTPVSVAMAPSNVIAQRP
jgi:Copper amine oxidase N-terminal domain